MRIHHVFYKVVLWKYFDQYIIVHLTAPCNTGCWYLYIYIYVSNCVHFSQIYYFFIIAFFFGIVVIVDITLTVDLFPLLIIYEHTFMMPHLSCIGLLLSIT